MLIMILFLNELNNKINSIQENEGQEKKPTEEFKKINLDMEEKLYYMIKNYNFEKIRAFLSGRLLYQQEQVDSSRMEFPPHPQR